MANKEIKYNGYTAVPSDYECPDGDLALSLNLLNENGNINPLSPPEPAITINLKSPKVFIHNFAGHRNIIAWNNSPALFLIDNSGNTSFILALESGQSILSLTSVGSIVIVSTTSGLYYLQYKTDSNSYVSLGSGVPDINMRFALRNEFTYSKISDSGVSVDKNNKVSVPDDMLSTKLMLDIRGNLASMTCSPHPTNREYSTEYIPLLPPPGFSVEEHGATPYRQGETLLIDIDNVHWIGNYQTFADISFYSCHNGVYTRVAEVILSYNATAGSCRVVLPADIDVLYYQVRITLARVADANDIYSATLTISSSGQLTQDVSDDMPFTIPYTSENFTALKGAINEFIASKATAKNKFIYPFFVCYALRLYDGSYARVSPPVLLIPNSGFAPCVGFIPQKQNSASLYLASFLSQLAYRFDTVIPEPWKDLIAGVDIFISEPIWTYNQGEEFSLNKYLFAFSPQPRGKAYCWTSISNHTDLQQAVTAMLPEAVSAFVAVSARQDKEVLDNVASTSLFYKIASIETEQIQANTDFKLLDMPDGCLKGLAARQHLDLTQVPLQYSGYKGAKLSSYNNRLIITPDTVLPPKPTSLDYCNGYTAQSSRAASVTVILKTAEGMRAVRTTITANGPMGHTPWFFYPDARATTAVVKYQDGDTFVIPLKPHDMLNGSYALTDSLDTSFPASLPTEVPSSTLPVAISTHGLIYCSQVGNPFAFVSTVEIPDTKVVALTAAAKALSQGQFGQFPLYAFTNDGVWALETSSTGLFNARQPITRDVILQGSDPLQMDSAVLFATNRGIMLISGSQTQCITDTINGVNPFDISCLPGMDKLHAMLGHPYDSCLPMVPFLQFLKDSGMLYDYVHQRVIVFNPNYTYAFVYSLKSHAWGMMYSNIEAAVNSYPEALAVDHHGTLLNFSAAGGQPTNGLLLTRPLKLDAPNIHKTIDCIIQRGNFAKGNVQSILYGSRDLINWHLVWSSKDHYLRGFRGTPYKYFRIACITSLSEDESIYGASVQFTPRLTNQPR